MRQVRRSANGHLTQVNTHIRAIQGTHFAIQGIRHVLQIGIVDERVTLELMGCAVLVFFLTCIFVIVIHIFVGSNLTDKKTIYWG